MNHISELAQLGTSTWLDDLSRERLVSGNLEEIISAKSIVGVTTNPAIFAAAARAARSTLSTVSGSISEGVPPPKKMEASRRGPVNARWA